MNTKEIKAKYLVQHNALGQQKDAPDKTLFDQQHHQIWADCDTELLARKAELLIKAVKTTDETKEVEALKREFWGR